MDRNYTLNYDVFQKISSLIYKSIGVNLHDKKRAMVNSRLSKRLYKLGLTSFEEYYQYLINTPQELSQIYNILTTNVTKFFREEYHFKFIKEQVLPRIEKRNKNKSIRVWSAGCSSGEEAYSLAIILREYFINTSWDIKILATDINTDVLKTGKEGIYSYDKVNAIPYDLLKKYFKLGRGKQANLFKAKEELRDLIEFKKINLNQLEDSSIKDNLDFIFCRNVFIYFRPKTREKIIKQFYQKLKDDGYLFLGHSESINSSRQVEEKLRSVYKTTYQKIT
ncbi:CheR family methyltransferase [Orenia marismortui]|uniref:protein-glutamate O-methyltransferase n=1 Tax=Orenia marismortui TaxID=46469 RepID=A0A4R8H010_9FIRM|nr:protein-glutamate O-methyltransferase CheR [Orenia marismortui]TDX47823.1 CheR-type MCP methyltransferase [Orenia marismortui]